MSPFMKYAQRMREIDDRFWDVMKRKRKQLRLKDVQRLSMTIQLWQPGRREIHGMADYWDAAGRALK